MSNFKKRCSFTGPTYQDTLTARSPYANFLSTSSSPSSKHLSSQCLGTCPPISKATWPANSTRGVPLTGNINMPGFMLTRAFSLSHAVHYNKAKTIFVSQGLNVFGKAVGSPTGSGSGLPSNF